MKQVTFNTQTGDIIVEEADVKNINIEQSVQPPTIEERLQAAENALITLMGGAI